VASAPDRARHEIQEAAGVTREALREVRETVAGYRRPTLVGELAGAQEMLAAAGIGYHLEGQPPELPLETESALAWMLREAITNFICHSRARRCVVRLSEQQGGIELEVIDDGQGCPAGSNGQGSGLAGAAERMTLLAADARPGQPRRVAFADGIAELASLSAASEPELAKATEPA
jgi:two-component system sensor histidine kinase DesK